jgi:hypothetical protein
MKYRATPCKGEMVDLPLQAGAITKEDQKIRKQHAYFEPVEMSSARSAVDGRYTWMKGRTGRLRRRSV